jgi:hypothetical protein
MRRTTSIALVWLGWVALWGIVPEQAFGQGCAMCKTALGGPEDPLAVGLNASILFLMSMPFVLIGSVGAWLAYMHRQNRPRRATVYELHTQKEAGP